MAIRPDPSGSVSPKAKGGEVGPSQWSKLVAGLDLGGTLHGFKSTLRTWAADESVPREIAELCLEHRIRSAAEQADSRGDVLEPQRQVINDWAQSLAV